MTLWEKVSKGIDSAKKATESAIDEGKLRVAAYKARQRANTRAETLGYAVARAKAEGRDPDPDAIGRLVDSVNAADKEASGLEAQTRGSGEPGKPGNEEQGPEDAAPVA
jgi:hypothetical protein